MTRQPRSLVCPACGQSVCYTHCVWCLTDCDQPDPTHLPYCPTATGVFPAHGDEHCCDCGDPVGPTYALIPDGDWDRVVCLPCAVTR